VTRPDDEPTGDMTGDMTEVLTRTLHRHAEDAPSVAGLPERAVAVAGRRRRRRTTALVAAVAALAAGIPVAVVATLDGATPPAAHEAHPTWRWESYLGVQVQVPPDWGYGVAGPSWCAGDAESAASEVRPGAVGRPGAMLAILCGTDYPPVGERENWLTFDSVPRPGEHEVDHGWVEETRTVADVRVTVFSDDAVLRHDILASAQPIDGTDRHGCATDPPVAQDADYRPAPDGGLPPADAVESVSVCRYTLASTDSDRTLLSSSRITGATARGVVSAIHAAPEGDGPDGDPGDRGGEIALLHVETTEGAHEVVLRYSGTTYNGFDDGTTRHQLTADAIRPLLTGPNSPTEMSMPVAQLLGS
jgi:hypothetical protein